MKTKSIRFLAALFTAGLLFSCSEKESFDDAKTTADVEFGFNIGDFLQTRNGNGENIVPGSPGSCPEMQTLISMVNANNLYANITVRGIATPLKLKVRALSDGSLQTDAYPFALNTYYIDAATITDNTDKILFSGVSTGSKYKNYVPDGELMTEKTFIVGPNDKFKKVVRDLWVLCAESQTPQDFGFVKWNVHYVKSHCFPIMVNACDDEHGDHQPTGFVKIEYKVGSKGIDGAGTYQVLHESLPFSEGSGYGSICFKDDYDITDNTTEIHRITIKIPATEEMDAIERVVELSTAELLDYKNHKHANGEAAWNEDLNFMHINFCTCETWKFECCEASYDYPEGLFTPDFESKINGLIPYYAGSNPPIIEGLLDVYPVLGLIHMDPNDNFMFFTHDYFTLADQSGNSIKFDLKVGSGNFISEDQATITGCGNMFSVYFNTLRGTGMYYRSLLSGIKTPEGVRELSFAIMALTPDGSRYQWYYALKDKDGMSEFITPMLEDGLSGNSVIPIPDTEVPFR